MPIPAILLHNASFFFVVLPNPSSTRSLSLSHSHRPYLFCSTSCAGDQPPCGLFYADPDSGEQCPSYCDYDTDAGKCEPKGQTAKCSEIYDQDKCSGSCTWRDDIYKCWDSGQDVPCVEYHYMDKDTCPSQCKFVETTPKSGDFDAEGICIGTSTWCTRVVCVSGLRRHNLASENVHLRRGGASMASFSQSGRRAGSGCVPAILLGLFSKFTYLGLAPSQAKKLRAMIHLQRRRRKVLPNGALQVLRIPTEPVLGQGP